MGLAAGQARLLTITGRKSDCEYQSMRLSHQKIALARDLANLSNEYQASLDKTKLYYDYYGKGDMSNLLSYNILMTPSALNNYMPVLITDTAGRVTLNSKYAAAARAAGIPQEGMGTLPSENMRNEFIQGLYGTGLITKTLAGTILGLPYNQAAGLGGGTTISVQTQDVSLSQLTKILSETYVTPTDTKSLDNSITDGIALLNNQTSEYYANTSYNDFLSIKGMGEERKWAKGLKKTEPKQLNLGDILNGDYTLMASGKGNRTSSIGYEGGAIDAVVNSSFWDTMLTTLEGLFDTGDNYTKGALSYARTNIENMISNQCNTQGKASPKGDDNANKYDKRQFFNGDDMKNFAFFQLDNKNGNLRTFWDGYCLTSPNSSSGWMVNDAYIGLVARGNQDSGHDDKNDCKSVVAVNLSLVMKAYLTYFYDYMNGVAKTDSQGKDKYCVGNKLSTSRFVDDTSVFKIKTGASISSDALAQATFYDALFNQLCKNGWTENEKIDDKEYLQEVLQGGMGFISKIKDDNYYYQGNYSIDSYIKEISDDTAIAGAEAKYKTEKAKLNSKEQMLDLKMKNLDTEISSLTTEYDTVKNTISKNIEKSFKRFSA